MGGRFQGITLQNFTADTSALIGNTATMTLTLYSDTGVGFVTKLFSELVADSTFYFDEFDPGDNVNFSNILRIDLSWGNFTATGADFSFSIFGAVNTLPEPGTAAMLILALGLVMMIRRQNHVQPALATTSGACRSPVLYTGASSSDIYA